MPEYVITKEIAAFVKEIREERFVKSQPEMALACGNMSRSTYQKMEKPGARVSIDTVNRVAQALGVPASTLIGGVVGTKSRLKPVFVLTSAMSRKGFYADLVYDLSLAVQEANMDIVLRVSSVEYDARSLDASLAHIERQRGEYRAGLVVTPLPETDPDRLARFCDRFAKPTVLVDFWSRQMQALLSRETVRFVTFDNAMGGRRAAEWVAEELVRRDVPAPHVLVVASHMQTDRQTAFREDLHNRLPSAEFVLRENGEFDRDKSATLTCDAFKSNDCPFDVVFCTNDEMALGAVSALSRMGIEPSATFVVGYDAILEARSRIHERHFLLNSVAQSTQKLARESMAALLEMLRGEERAQSDRIIRLEPKMYL